MKSWPHAPPHWTHEAGIYFITAATYEKKHFFKNDRRLDFLTNLLLETLTASSWRADAWAVFPNHYHLIIRSSSESRPLSRVLGKIHMLSSKELNLHDGTPSRKVWHNYWDTHLTFENSHFARLNYVMENPVHHRMVLVANQYPWCSAAWFEKSAARSFVETIRSFPIDQLGIEDDL